MPTMIPKSLSVSGRCVDLFVMDRPDPEDENTQGWYEPFAATIKLSSHLSPDQLRATALHEVLHDLDTLVGTELTERDVRALGTVLFEVFRSNPDFVKWLMGW